MTKLQVSIGIALGTLVELMNLSDSFTIKHRTYGLLAAALGASMLTGIEGATAQAQPIINFPVAFNFQPAPDTDPAVRFQFFREITLNDPGQVTFGGTVAAHNNQVIYSNSGGSLRLLARGGDTAPGAGSGMRFDGFSDPVLNNAGQTFFTGHVDDFGNEFVADSIYLATEGDLELIALFGDPAPGTPPGVNYSYFSLPPLLNDAGQIAFTAPLTGPDVRARDVAIFSNISGTLSLVARDRGVVPGSDPSRNFHRISRGPVLNDAGQLVFSAGLSGPNAIGPEDNAIFSQSNGNLEIVARKGDPMPSVGSDLYYGRSSSLTINNRGEIATVSLVTGPDIDFSNDRALLIFNPDLTQRRIAREAEIVQIDGQDVRFSDFFTPALNDAGHVAFRAILEGPGIDSTNNQVIYTDNEFELRPIARLGNSVPGISSDVRFAEFQGDPAFNDIGQVAFIADFTGPGVDRTNDRGLFVTDPSGELRMLTREGDLFDINPNPLITDNRTVEVAAFVTGTSSSDGRQSTFNNSGQLAYWIRFTDGTSGVFIATFVPEPESLVILCTGLVLWVGRNRT